jgi:16S rRNA (guanine(527)-N(7))-methyltransferase RsmG
MTSHPTGDRNATLEAYLDELDRWSQRLNLTSIPRDEAWSRNVAEAEGLLEAAVPGTGSSVIDIGSGGGVPGIVIAILRPDLEVTLLDADRRKSGFLIHVAGLLGLQSVHVVAERAEDACRRDGMRETFDLAVSRATAPPPVLCELALPLVRVGGSLCALVSDARAATGTCAAAASACGGGAPEALSDGILRISTRGDRARRAATRSARDETGSRRSPPLARSTGSHGQRSRASSRDPCRHKGRCPPARRAPPRSRSRRCGRG